MKVIQGENVPIKMWVRDEDIESGTIDQARELAKLPFLYKWVALMPDCHHGYGMPIGGVMATKGYVLPNAVGVDIGCGMIAQKTNIKVEDFTTEQLKQIMGKIRESVPVGFSKHKTPCGDDEMPKQRRNLLPIVREEYGNACLSLGTLGGGNHFIEVQKGDDGYIWIMIHSGSRNLGKKVCDYYNKLAKELNEEWHSKAPRDLNFLPLDSDEGKDYFVEMNYCLEFAQKNREKMMDACLTALVDITLISPICAGNPINIHHNYAAMENHYGENVMVHRKGATKATEGLTGIIPGSQGTCSYIVEGLGNRESFMSCSHGAGRKMGRNDAKRTLDFDAEKKAMDDKGILHTVWSKGDLDEAPGSYKDIQQVMANQKDLVKILVRLEPLGVIKG